MEIVANSPTPGVAAPISALGAAVITTPPAGTVETWTLATPITVAALTTPGTQFRFTVDREICLDTTGSASLTRTVVRGAEGSTPATHLGGGVTNIYHSLTAGGLSSQAPTPRGRLQVFGHSIAADPENGFQSKLGALISCVPENCAIGGSVVAWDDTKTAGGSRRSRRS